MGVVLAGPVSDRFGRRPVLVAGCGLFAASSILCALAPNVEFLVAFRIGQALGYGAVSTHRDGHDQGCLRGDPT